MAAAIVVTAATAGVRAMPEAILLSDVEALGDKGTVVDVSKGYLRNFLIPRGLAQPATKGALKVALQQQETTERTQREAQSQAAENAALLSKTVLTLSQSAGDDGRLFGSVTTQDIADAIFDARAIRVDKKKIHLEEPIKNVGTHMVAVEMADGVTATIKTMVTEK